jgi:HEAT repeat protein
MLRCAAAVLTGLWFASTVPTVRAGVEEAAAKAIKSLLNKDSTKVERFKALMVLEVVPPKTKGVLQALKIALAKDPEALIRREIAQIMGRMGEDGVDTIPDLAFAMLKDADDKTRECAAKALNSMTPHSKRVLKELVEALQDKYFPVRAGAAEAIKNLGMNAQTFVPQLIDYLKDKSALENDRVGRLHVALALGRVGQDARPAVTLLAEMVADDNEDSRVRTAAADTLGRLGLDASKASKELAGVVVNDKNTLELRLAAVKALGKVDADTATAWPAFKAAMEDEKEKSLRLQAVRVVGPYAKEKEEVVKYLGKLARADDSVDVRLAAVQELGALGATARSAEPVLRQVIDNEEIEVVRDAARTALKKILAAK